MNEEQKKAKIAAMQLLQSAVEDLIKGAIGTTAVIGRDAGGRELSTVITKLQEAKSWAGIGIEEIQKA